MGYVDKILSCLETRTIPIYLGADNIDNYVPRECFIDFRSFRDYGELDRFIGALSEKQYRDYVCAIDDFVVSGGLRPYTWNTLYDQLIQIHAASGGKNIGSLCGSASVWGWGLSGGLGEPNFRKIEGKHLWSFTELANHRGEVVIAEKWTAPPSGKAEDAIGQSVDRLGRTSGKELLLDSQKEMIRLRGMIESGLADANDHYRYAQFLILAERFDETVPVLHKVISLFPAHSYALNDLGVIHFRKSEFDEALAFWLRALNASPGNHNALHNALRLLKGVNKENEMATLAGEILERLPGPEEVRSQVLAVLREFDLPHERLDRSDEAQSFSATGSQEQVQGKAGQPSSIGDGNLPTQPAGRNGDSYYVHKTAQLERPELIKIGKGAEIKDYVIIRTYQGLVVIGENTQLNPFTVIYGGNSIHIGNNVMIAPHCMIAAGNHDYVQTDIPMRFAGTVTKGPIVIEDNVWIGANCTITDGVRIGRDAVVAANSLVNKNVDPYAIVGGVPAKVIGSRKREKAERTSIQSAAANGVAESTPTDESLTRTVKVLIDSSAFDGQGYDEDDMRKNGEHKLVSELIEDGDVVFDVGANKGIWSGQVLSRHGQVRLFAFEPVPETFEILRKSIATNSGAVSIINGAVSHEDGKKTFYHYVNNDKIAELSTFHRRTSVEKQLGLKSRPISVEAIRLDTFCTEHAIDHIDYLKIDTEGGEHDVLRGAVGLLREKKIKFIQFEYGGAYRDAKIGLSQVYELLSGFGYSLFRLLPDSLLHIPKWRDELETYRLSNYLAVSSGHSGRWKAMEAARDRTTGMIVFSKDRAIQLDGALRSLFSHCKDLGEGRLRVQVLYTSSSYFHETQYRQMAQRFPDVTFMREHDFKKDLLACLIGHDYVFFMVDDNIFVKDFLLKDIIEALNRNHRAIGFSLRLGRNTGYCYMQRRDQSLPPFSDAGEDLLLFDWTSGESDFAYPLEVSSSVYRVSDIEPLLKHLDFSNPNILEATLDANKSTYQATKPNLLCYGSSVAFCNPANKVQTVFTANRAGEDNAYGAVRLANIFAKGYRINIEEYSGFVPRSCHQEVDYVFERQNGHTGEVIALERRLVTIGILNCNGLEQIKVCLEAVARNTPEDHEIIVVDNGSTDGSVEYLRSLANIILIENPENLGPTTRNKFITLARGRYVVFLDNDTIVTRDWLTRLVEFASSDGEIGIIGACANYASGLQLVQNTSYKDIQELEQFAASRAAEYGNTLWRSPRLVTMCVLLRQELVERIGGLDETFGMFGFEDDDYAIRATIAGFKSVVAPGVFIHHTGGPQGRGDRQYNAWLHESWEVFKKKWGIAA